ncbi:hypothetical protein Bca4012_018425 [Brassica carinata]
MGRAPCCEKVGIKRGRWTAEEDQILSSYIQSNGEGSWRSLPKNAGRTDNEIKNYWNSHLRRKLHNFIIRKPSISHDVLAVVMNAPPASPPPPTKRRPGRTSRSAMKPKTHNPKIRKMKKTSETPETEADVAVKAVAGEEELMTDSIGGDKEVSSFDEDIIKLLLDESDPSHVFTELNHLGDSVQAKGSSEILNQEKLDCLQSGPSMESFLNYEHQVNNAFTDEFIDWDCVWQQGNYNKICDEKESSDSMVSWLLDGDDEATIGKSNCENSGEPLNHHDEENALVAWLLS